MTTHILLNQRGFKDENDYAENLTLIEKLTRKDPLGKIKNTVRVEKNGKVVVKHMSIHEQLGFGEQTQTYMEALFTLEGEKKSKKS